jgi:hypothetical protein
MSFIKESYVNDIYTDAAYHWLMFLKHKNGFYLRREALTVKEGKDTSKEALKAYYDINDQIIKEFGTDESFMNHLANEEQLAMLKLEYLINKNGYYQTLYQIEQAKKEEREKAQEGKFEDYDLNKEIGIISKYFGSMPVNIKEVTIHQYLTAKQTLKDG